MEPSSSRHQCVIYDGAPSHHLRALAAIACKKLEQNYRCLYLNSRPMVAGMRSYLAAAGLDVEHEVGKASLVLSSEQGHLVNGHFDVNRMMDMLEHALTQALNDGYAGLWASGDMTWEMGPDNDYSRLLEYEWRLEEFFLKHAEMSGICQYHVHTLPREIVRHGVVIHPSLFVNETLSLANPQYLPPEAFARTMRNQEMDSVIHQEIDSIIHVLCQSGSHTS